MKKMDNDFWFWFIIAGVGSVIMFIASSYAAWQTNKYQNEAKLKREEIIEMNQSIENALTRVEFLNKKIDSSTRKLKKLAKKIKRNY